MPVGSMNEKLQKQIKKLHLFTFLNLFLIFVCVVAYGIHRTSRFLILTTMGGNMRLTTITLAAVVALSSASFAETTAPGDIKFGENGEVEISLTGAAGDAASGRKIFMNRKKGNCLACHVNSDMAEQTFHGEVGPELDGVADRWEAAELRGILVNSKNMFEGTIMPAFYKASGYNRILKKFDGKTILSAQEVEDLLAYVMTLKE